MKTVKSILILSSLIILFFGLLAFKNEDPQVEYCLITTNYSNVIIVDQAGPINENFPKGITKEHFLIQVLNKKSKDGWKVVNFSGLNSTTSTREFLLSREKNTNK
jgi:hypothetical protein